MVIGTRVPVKVGRCQANDKDGKYKKAKKVRIVLKEIVYRHTPKCYMQHSIILRSLRTKNSKNCIQIIDGQNGCMEVEGLSSLLAHSHYEETCVICEK